MAEADDDDKSGAPSIGADATAVHAALDAAGSSEEARVYLRRQSRLVELQIDNLEKQDEFELSHLRFRHFSDYARFSLQGVAALLVLAIAVAICGAVWSAAHDSSLIIESFSVPPDLANRGLTGQAVAAQLQDKLAALQNATDSARPPSSYANNWGNDIKVQIPDTGVSVGEFYRLLTAALGHQTHITGEVYRTAKGIAVTARTGGEEGATASGVEADFDSILERAAEAIYARTQPYRYATYIQAHGKPVEAKAIFERLAANWAMPRERAWAYIGLGTADAQLGDGAGSIENPWKAVVIIPDFALAWTNLDGFNQNLGHDEAALEAQRAAVRLLKSGGDVDMTPQSRLASAAIEQANLDFYLCDYESALKDNLIGAAGPDYSGIVESSRENIPLVLESLHEQTAAMKAWLALPPDRDLGDQFQRATNLIELDYFVGDWSSLLAQQREVRAAADNAIKHGLAVYSPLPLVEPTLIRPAVAYALAAKGDFRGALAAAAAMPADCVFCLRVRGGIDALMRNWDGANYWYARAAQIAPSIPIVYSEWGRLLLCKGDLDDAITKFTLANQKGPQLAHPLEMWGEALTRSNRSDLALAKFAEANKYAPNWGRLHLKWGEALLWSGDEAGANKQFDIAAGLDLSAADKSQLARARTIHG